MDPLRFLIDVEEASGVMDASEYAEGYAGLIRSRIIHGLQGFHQRAAARLVESGIIVSVDGEIKVDHDRLEEMSEAF
jgi:hypothetical protein